MLCGSLLCSSSSSSSSKCGKPNTVSSKIHRNVGMGEEVVGIGQVGGGGRAQAGNGGGGGVVIGG